MGTHVSHSLLSKWLDTGLTVSMLTLVLCHLLILVPIFDYAGVWLGELLADRFWLPRHMTEDRRWFSSLTPVVSKEYNTFGIMDEDGCFQKVW
jgi:hypothetical protein